MRADFQHQLDSLRADMGGMCELAGDAMDERDARSAGR